MTTDIFLINLRRTPARLQSFQDNNPHIKFKIFDAVDGGLLNKTKLIQDGFMMPNCSYSSSALGCALSHLSLWHKCVEMNKPITILEDDAILHSKWISAIENLGPADSFVVWGWNFDALLCIDFEHGLGYTLCHFDQHKITKFQNYINRDVDYKLYPLGWMYGIFAYTISPDAAKALIARNLPLGRPSVRIPRNSKPENVGIDVAMCYDYQDLNAKVSFPPLAISLNDKSISTVNREIR